MQLTAEPAFVLHARPWRETSLLVEVLTATHGRVGLVARGVQGPKRHVLRAALQPLQLIRLEAVLRGELARLINAEAVDVAPRLGGNAMLGAFYLNELTLRLAPRLDPAPELFVAYAAARERLRAGEPLAWTLRQLAAQGPRTFYEGEIARRILATSQRLGGTMTAADLDAVAVLAAVAGRTVPGLQRGSELHPRTEAYLRPRANAEPGLVAAQTGLRKNCPLCV
mgnify:CR=1 FL=1